MRAELGPRNPPCLIFEAVSLELVGGYRCLVGAGRRVSRAGTRADVGSSPTLDEVFSTCGAIGARPKVEVLFVRYVLRT